MNRYLLGFLVCVTIDLTIFVIAISHGKWRDRIIEKHGAELYLVWLVALVYTTAFLAALRHLS